MASSSRGCPRGAGVPSGSPLQAQAQRRGLLARVRRPRVALACTAGPRLSPGVPAPPRPRARLPFSVCSMIWRMAFFRLLALSISCSRGRNIWGRAGQAEPTARAPVEPEPQPPPAPSPSSASSAMVGGGVGREDEACDSSSRVFSRESSFSLRTEHWAGKEAGVEACLPAPTPPPPRG